MPEWLEWIAVGIVAVIVVVLAGEVFTRIFKVR